MEHADTIRLHRAGIARRLLLCALSLSLALACETEQGVQSPEEGGLFATKSGVHTRLKCKLGELEGTLLRQTRAFLGIPYARPPVGKLRFSPPQPGEFWTGVRDATMFGPICPQPKVGPFAVDFPMDEDCLTLNIYTPDPPPERLLPVMIYIHGGGLAFGSSRELSPERLSEAGPVVVVTIQYRLGALGFFTHSDLDAVRAGTPSGNDGLRDQRLAIQWVQDHVAEFGGDSHNITLFGASAGSTSVCFHLVSPASSGIATRAIMQSNECALMNRAAHRDEADVLAGDLVETFCPERGGAALVDCLRSQDAGALAAFGSEMRDMPGVLMNTYGNPGWNVVVDGPAGLLPDDAASLFARGEYEHLQLIIGSTKREAAVWETLDVEPYEVHTVAEFRGYVKARFGATLGPEVNTRYGPSTDADANEAYVRLSTDIQVRCPTRSLARSLSMRGSEVYLYSFEDGAALHGEDIQVLSASIGTAQRKGSTGALPLAALMKSYWTRFAGTGNPSGPDTPNWPQYSVDSDAHMVLAAESSAGTGLASDECDFWDQVSREKGAWIWP
jgi:para-nitrobenzyl esterase